MKPDKSKFTMLGAANDMYETILIANQIHDAMLKLELRVMKVGSFHSGAGHETDRERRLTVFAEFLLGCLMLVVEV